VAQNVLSRRKYGARSNLCMLPMIPRALIELRQHRRRHDD